ncbi:MAG: extracellular solute-binding protein [Albidovulum sp.]|nr:extracellular solute-binding protein [Albidovulum sp.]
MSFSIKSTQRVVGAALVSAMVFGAVSFEAALAADRNLKVWFGRENFIPDDRFATFNAEYPDINVEFEVIRLEDVITQLILALRSGTAPDIVQIHTRDVAQLAQGGVVKNVSHMIEEMKQRFPVTYEQLAPLAWEGASDFDGNLYGIALYAQSIYLTYRTDWLDEAGIEYPLETTDRVLEAAKALTTLPEGGERFGFSLLGCCNSPTWEMPLFLAMGGEVINGVPQVDTEIGIAWIEFYQELMRSQAAHPDTPSWDSGQMRAAFIGERAGMMNMGEHIYVELHKQVPYEEGRWTFERLPTRPGQTEPHVQSGFAFPFIVTTANEDEEAAMLALEYLSRPAFAKQVAIRYQPTTNTAVSEDAEYLAAKPWATDISPLSSNLISLPTHPTKAIQIYDVLQELRDLMVSSPNSDAAEMAANAQEALNAAAGL